MASRLAITERRTLPRRGSRKIISAGLISAEQSSSRAPSHHPTFAMGRAIKGRAIALRWGHARTIVLAEGANPRSFVGTKPSRGSESLSTSSGNRDVSAGLPCVLESRRAAGENLRQPPRIAAKLLVVLVLLMTGPRSHAAERPALFPTRDVSIVYDVFWPNRPRVRERVRWLASKGLARIDGPNHSTIFDRNAHFVVLLNPATHTYSAVEGAPRWAIEPEPDSVLNRGNESVITGLRCTEWSWAEDMQIYTACLSSDGVLLRLIIDGERRLEALSVSYAAQADDIFQIPSDYAPTIELPQAPRLVR